MRTMDEAEKRHAKYTARNWGDFLDHASMRHNHDSIAGDGSSTEVEEYAENLKQAMRKYATDNCDALNECFENYKEGDSQEFFTKCYELADTEDLDAMLSKCKIMVITANPIEKAILHFEVAKSNRKICRILGKQNVYFFFKWEAYWVAHVHQGETGANKDMGANSTICDALAHFTPNIIISLGVAFGIDYTTQQIGDVLVSKRILPYSENKLDEDKLKPDRSQDKTIDSWLHVRLKSTAEFLDSVTYGDVLTGGSVLSSFEEKDKICLGYTKADFVIGGEMEGNAVFQTAQRVGIPGVVIKGICDWGVAKNDIFMEEANTSYETLEHNGTLEQEEAREEEEKFKDSLQAYAMKKAVVKCSLLLKDKGLFSSPKNENIEKIKKQNKVAKYAVSISAISQLIVFIWSVWELSRYIVYVSKEAYFPAVELAVTLVVFFLSLVSVVLCFVFWGYRKSSNRNPSKLG